MASQRVAVLAPGGAGAVRLARWRVRGGACVAAGQVLCVCEAGGAGAGAVRVRAPRGGVLRARAVEGATLQAGECIAEIEECRHTTVMKQMCAECGADLSNEDSQTAAPAVVPMVHSVPELKVTEELAKKLGREDSERLLKDRKLVLLVDLDQTLVHTTNENVPPNLKGVSHYWLRGPGGGRWYHTRLRPGTRKFLQSASALYELHVCTFGARQYAHAVARVLDPGGEYFSHRILSRDECFDARAKAANLKALFPCGDNMVCIIDDREDVWRHATNLIHVRPYSFFHSTGDINAPPQGDEKSRLISGKNGSQVPVPPEKEMPCLDPDQDLKDAKNERIREALPKVETETKEGSNGKVKPKEITSAGIVENYSKKDTDKMDEDVCDNIIGAMGSSETLCKDKGTEINKSEVNNSEINKTELNDSKIQKASYEKENVARMELDGTKKDDNKFETNNSEANKTETNKTEGNSEGTESIKEVKVEKMETDVAKKEDEPKWVETSDGQMDMEDPDDYLIYLEDILQRIHKYFYELYDKMEAGNVPDLKTVIPEVKSRVLSGTSLVFSGLVPTQQRLESSRAYLVAKSLGAEVTQDFTPNTTHLVAVRPGTAKVNTGRKIGSGLCVVTPDWLWSCAERWERVDERLFVLENKQLPSARRPPAHCSSPPPPPAPALRKRTPSGRFMDTLNPLLSFSTADIADMDKEVEDILDDESEESSVESETEARDDDLDDEENPPEDRLLGADVDDTSSRDHRLRDDTRDSSSNGSASSLTGDSVLRPRKRQRTSSPPPSDDESKEPPDDDSWNLMGEALEREFLGLD